MVKFPFDINLKKGKYSSHYFKNAVQIVNKYKPKEIVCMQFIHFSNEKIMICGVEESVQLLKFCLTKEELKMVKVYGVKDGSLAKGKTPILLIFGPYQLFGKFENIIDGILARRSSVCNNCYSMLKLIKSSQLIYMADRTDDYLVQPYDGYAAYVAGVKNFVTEASVSFFKNDPSIRVTGTIPHALIQEFDGNLVSAMKAYINEFGSERAIALIDYHNDVVKEIKLLSKSFKDLYAVRIDTSSQLLDKSLQVKYRNDKNAYGVSPQLVALTRKTLDKFGLIETKIVVSSGINNTKILNFIKHKSPIDFYGVGSNLITRNVHFTADLVLKNNIASAKFGRKLFIKINKIKTLKKYI